MLSRTTFLRYHKLNILNFASLSRHIYTEAVDVTAAVVFQLLCYRFFLLFQNQPSGYTRTRKRNRTNRNDGTQKSWPIKSARFSNISLDYRCTVISYFFSNIFTAFFLRLLFIRDINIFLLSSAFIIQFISHDFVGARGCYNFHVILRLLYHHTPFVVYWYLLLRFFSPH